MRKMGRKLKVGKGYSKGTKDVNQSGISAPVSEVENVLSNIDEEHFQNDEDESSGYSDAPESFQDDTDENSVSEAAESDLSNDDDDDADDDDLSYEDVSSAKLKRDLVKDDDESETKAKKRKTSDRPPTLKEINQLKETQNLFHSNIFRLQIDEMLKEVKIKTKYEALLNIWISSFTKLVNEIEATDSNVDNCKWLKNLKVKCPFKDGCPNPKTVFSFAKPQSVSLAGSYALGCCLGPKGVIDVIVEIPKTCFRDKDYLNHSYLHKRSFYLARIASQLSGSNLVSDVKFSYVSASNMYPVIMVTPSGKLGEKLTVLITAVPADGCFTLNRFNLNKSNVQTSWLLNDPSVSERFPTPHLNNTVLRDLTWRNHNELLASVVKSHQNICDGIILLKVWLRQRGLDRGYGSFNGHILEMYVAYLVYIRRINYMMSSYQIARNVWSTLAQSDWIKSGITLCPTSNPSLEEFHKYFEVVFVDPTGFCNLCADMTQETYLKVRKESELAIKYLDEFGKNSFQVLFMTELPFHLQYDHLIRIDVGQIEIMVRKHKSLEAKVDFAYDILPQALFIILPLLRKALGERVESIGIKLQAPLNWEIHKSPPIELKNFLLLGLNLHPEFAFNTILKGPEANLPEAENFRTFWADKSELRRFQDGSICEAVVWLNNSTIASRRVICEKIVKHVLENKLELCVNYIADQFEELINVNHIQVENFESGGGEEAALSAISSLDNLTKCLRELNDLPLQISTVLPSAATFHYCETFPPLPVDLSHLNKTLISSKNCSLFNETDTKLVPHWVPALDVVIQLSLSNKWPDDLEAVRCIRAAFNVKIAQALRKKFNLTCQANLNHVDVLKDGYVFRLNIAYQREIGLIKTIVTPDGETQYKDNAESIALEKKTVLLPRLTSALHGLQMQHSSFGAACRLTKRWLSSQLLDNFHFPSVCVELLIAYLYLYPQPFQVPAQPQVAFLRFLKLMSTTNWQLEPIILNLNEELEKDDISEIESKFNTTRSCLPPLFLATPYDMTGSVWTKEAPTCQILIRVAMLSSEALKIMDLHLLQGVHMDYKVLFRPTFDVYDVVIHLRPLNNPRRREAVDAPVKSTLLKKYTYVADEKIPVVGFNPIECYLDELRAAYGDFALFFHDTYGGSVIGVLWKPPALEERSFKVSQINCHKPSGGQNIVLNTEGIIEDFYSLGKDLVKTIETSVKKN